MSNELILIVSLVVVYGIVLLSYVLFEEKGLICWTAIATISTNIEVLILVKAFGMTQTLGNILFASTFLVTDILSELHGKKEANKAVNVGIFTSICFIILSQSWFLYTPESSDIMMPSIKTIFSNTPRLMLSGLVVYMVVQKLDLWLYHIIWGMTEKASGSKRGYLWFRNNVATLISQFLNTILFTFLAFWGKYDIDTIKSIILTSYIIFVFTSLLDTPIVYLARMWHDKKYGLD